MISVEEYIESRNSVSAKYAEFNSLKTRYPDHFLHFMKGKMHLIFIIN